MQLTKSQLVAGIYAATFVYDLGVHHRNKKRLDKLQKENIRLRADIAVKNMELRYMADMMNRTGVVPDEFDMITLPSFKKVNVS